MGSGIGGAVWLRPSYELSWHLASLRKSRNFENLDFSKILDFVHFQKPGFLTFSALPRIRICHFEHLDSGHFDILKTRILYFQTHFEKGEIPLNTPPPHPKGPGPARPRARGRCGGSILHPSRASKRPFFKKTDFGYFGKPGFLAFWHFQESGFDILNTWIPDALSVCVFRKSRISCC